MSRSLRYRLVLDGEPAGQDDLDRFETITVEQEVDMAWEARLETPVCLDAEGRWTGDQAEFMKSFARVRVELSVDDGPFAPLIDGPVVGRDSRRSAEPGRSMVTLVVHDDSAYLNREESLERFENMADDEIAERIFNEAEQIAEADVEPTPPPPDDTPPVVFRRGTRMRLLRQLARRQGMHAYVLPGDAPGASVGCFKPFPTKPGDLPALVLLGEDRNIASFDVQEDAQRAGTVQAARLSLTDKGIVEHTSRFRDLDLLGPDFSFEREEDTARRLAPPGPGSQADPDRRVAAETEASSFDIEGEGETLPCYGGVLRPYLVVTVKAGGTRSSGAYLIHAVTHRLTRSDYTQSFTLKRNAQSPVAASLPGAAKKIF